METIRSLIRGDLPPTGNQISLSKQPYTGFRLDGYITVGVDSGTSALALALLDAKLKHPEIASPEVILPAYCCPDLVSACLFAGCRPVAVDISPLDTAYDLEKLDLAITPNCVGVIAMTFLGVREDWQRLLPFIQLKHPNVSLIEDNAQWFPRHENTSQYFSDYLVFSFGRGKPLSLLGGGLLLAKNLDPNTLDILSEGTPLSSALTSIKVWTYNQLLHPNFYWFLNHNPIIKMGATKFQKLSAIRRLDKYRESLFGANHKIHCERNFNIEGKYDYLIQALKPELYFSPLKSPRRERLLRYPILCGNKSNRNILLEKLTRLGLGATSMYKSALIDIPQMGSMLRPHPCEAARNFAERLITLPCHENVTEKHFSLLKSCLTTS